MGGGIWKVEGQAPEKELRCDSSRMSDTSGFVFCTSRFERLELSLVLIPV